MSEFTPEQPPHISQVPEEINRAETLPRMLVAIHSRENHIDVENGLEDIAELEQHVQKIFDELEIRTEDQRAIHRYLSLLRGQHEPTYVHSLKVGVLARDIAQHEHGDEKALFMAGLLHDVGKVFVPHETLTKTVGWTAEDKKEMDEHVVDGVELLRGRFDFSAEIIARHHQFQERAYPEELPPQLQDWKPETQALIERYARLLSLADVYQALHRSNDRFTDAGSEQAIKEKMLTINPDQTELLEQLYQAGIFSVDGEEQRQAA